ncbi:LacI family DNA-binding transcriptional regulator [Cohnella nanjingensis]|uniref:LacI family DNA-binding transcriptional regulator n=1 Tax=Cohnella nanjingensis TaxID=1387779 RepID=A0A7X0RMH7_9BACL|nr:LacI family DNA-binding transcriptional regulator [Cohnella nanjingensis]MBB6670003.1 LacI family DNA-binding transcriptional regulator [Cohnella nanjingensis]
MATIKDVAREAGVSVAAASLALNGKGSLSDETRAKVIEAAERLNYTPNALAKGLVTSNKINTIGLIIPKPGTEFLPFVGMDILSGVGEVASEKKYNMLLDWEDSLGGSKALDLVQSGIVRGLLFFLPLNDVKTFRTLNDLNFPYVLMSRPPEGVYCSWVDVDNVDASYQATVSLIKSGHTRIGFSSPGPIDFLVSSDRHSGYRQALLSHNIAYDENYVSIGSGDIESGKKAMEHFLRQKEPPTALLAGSNLLAIGMIESLKEHGLDHRDMAVITFDDSPLAESYGISAIHIPTNVIAGESARLLIKRIANTRRTEPESIVIDSKLIVRNTFVPSK